MKKTMVLILALSALALSMLTGCGETGSAGNNGTTAPENTGVLPRADDLMPDATAPQTEDGNVNDTDGVITDGDNGPLEEIPDDGATANGGVNGTNGVTGTNGTNGTNGVTGTNGTGTVKKENSATMR